MGQPYVSGIGITSMRSRVQAFGGAFDLAPAPAGEPACRRGFRWNVTQVRVVVDDHMVFREGLRALLGRVEDIDIVGEAASTQEAVEVTEAVRPDVVLMDLNLPGHGGEVATGRSSQPTPR
jgi:hypothetical protein